jgi:hypothetical protein
MTNGSVYERMTDAEKLVAEYLKGLKLNWKFEYPVFLYDERKRPRVWTPDFYLTELGIYIEVCGSKEFDYKYRYGIYKNNKVDVVFLHMFRNKDEWQHHFRKELLVLVKDRLNQLNILVQLAT